jgi:hypothetical protein
MSFTAIVSGIFAVAKAVPMVKDLIDQIVSFYIDEKINAIDDERITEDDQRSALIGAIYKAETNAEIVAHSITLTQLNNGELRHTHT